MPARVLPFLRKEHPVVTTLKHAAVVAVAIMLVMWLNNITGRKLDSLAA